MQVDLNIGRFYDRLSIKEESLLDIKAITWINHCQLA